MAIPAHCHRAIDSISRPGRKTRGQMTNGDEWDARMNGGFLGVENVARISIEVAQAHLRN